MTPELKLYNTLTGHKDVFRPINPGHVRVYACGPTVYNHAHIGNARTAVSCDLLVRVLRLLYPDVTYVANITDVDDKIIAAAKDANQPIAAITDKFTRLYNEDMAALGVSLPDMQPRATEYIGEMIALIQKLVERGHAYVAYDREGATQGHVLFHVPSFPAYGSLSRRGREDQIAGARVEVSPFKRDPADFVLWKPSDARQPGWDSPWGLGRPGWHIECSAMAEKHLGLPFDIHGGGMDLKFPHHENEIAQSCCAHGHAGDLASFAKLWLHTGFLTVAGEKMSKSLGNVLLARDLLEQWPAETLRLALLSSHYRQPLDWTDALLQQSKAMLDTLYRALLTDDAPDPVLAGAALPDAVLAPLLDDLNMAGGLRGAARAGAAGAGGRRRRGGAGQGPVARGGPPARPAAERSTRLARLRHGGGWRSRTRRAAGRAAAGAAGEGFRARRRDPRHLRRAQYRHRGYGGGREMAAAVTYCVART